MNPYLEPGTTGISRIFEGGGSEPTWRAGASRMARGPPPLATGGRPDAVEERTGCRRRKKRCRDECALQWAAAFCPVALVHACIGAARAACVLSASCAGSLSGLLFLSRPLIKDGRGSFLNEGRGSFLNEGRGSFLKEGRGSSEGAAWPT